MSSEYRDGERSFARGYDRNPYTYEPRRVEWQRGYDAAKAAEEAAKAKQAEYDEQWRYLPASYRAMHELEQIVGDEQAEKIKALVAAMIAERHE